MGTTRALETGKMLGGEEAGELDRVLWEEG